MSGLTGSLTPEKALWRLLGGTLALLGVVVAGIPLSRLAEQVWLDCQLEGNGRQRALMKIAAEKYPFSADRILELLATETNRANIEAAAYAASRIDDRRALPLIQRHVDEGPGDEVCAKLMLYAARLSAGDLRLRPWLHRYLAAPEPWRQVGAAAGLVELGLPEGGDRLARLAVEGDPSVRSFAYTEFQRVAGAVLEMLGQIPDWSKLRPRDQPPPAEWATLQTAWREQVGLAVLNDYLLIDRQRDNRRHESDRLLRARERVARWLQVRRQSPARGS